MKWKIVASPANGQSNECQSSQPAAIASGTLKRAANLAVDNKAGSLFLFVAVFLGPSPWAASPERSLGAFLMSSVGTPSIRATTFASAKSRPSPL
jgi:hypothetical protein